MRRIMRTAVLAFSKRNRQKKARLILKFMADNGVHNAIFVGCSPGGNANERIVERAVADHADVLAACDILSAPGAWRFVLADGRALPFRDGATDLVVANAVIEHVGQADEQRTFVREQTRVARNWVITTPNRWFPVESHTSAIFRHWSTAWRDRHAEFTRLLSLREFSDLLPAGAVVHGRPWSATFTAFYRAPRAATTEQPVRLRAAQQDRE
ncbi:Methyltransferase domain-containing protein [Nakamurella panacisegetis]|uniref:Methyltransferase domain-containing protein n=1 Tax=Nakamurella panacisegetis TaxID=1090615 RepID=A0A1H0IJD7_9ACTN|nr:methyltransferase domain-containing protein [Nakamurella panacisegetis]SDO31151.1 Methyltransferase domain-containing protein [Nakamurella panacisegetis]